MKATLVLTLALAGCAADPQPVPPPPVPTPDQCPAGFGPLGDLQGCYREIAAATWSTGEDACERFAAGGTEAHLVIIDREEEHLAVSMMSLQGDLWIGRLQQDDDDAYRNINYIEYGRTYFGIGEPNDHGRNDCDGLVCDSHPGGGDERCIEYKHETGLWNDEKCGRTSRVICEWDDVAPYGWRPGADA